MPWQEGPELLLWHQISSSFSASFSSSWRQCRHRDPCHLHKTEIESVHVRLPSQRKEMFWSKCWIFFFAWDMLVKHKSLDH